MLLTVHDELVLEVPVDERERHRAARARGDGARHRAARAARRRRRLRPQLGRREVALDRATQCRSNCEHARAASKWTAQRVSRGLVRRGRGVPRAGVPAERVHEGHRARGRLPGRRARAEPGMRVLDVGCGPGRHSLALARRGIDVVGVDHSPDFVAARADAADGRGPRREFARARRARPRLRRRVRRRDLPVPGRLRAARRSRRARRVRSDRRARSRLGRSPRA